ncbi:hypothetical protein [Aliarcobacter cibarius]|uniref:Uncharacterized protein n=1 Tax=Aliarcobacter cibarius TaxID=255507 RepID=A0ABY2V2V0_9BACT|nr:hypothetical protein [Aliarcobacter cibarius]TLS96842.1 hypothetical protein FE247_09470 [Aliarcobacter cibarius]TLS97347.1 hypothetical protein FE245_09480 [Aliarcobacter cibarius]
MKNLCTVEELEIVEIEIDEEIEKKNLKDFISTSLKLKNINLPKNKKIILNYIEELKTYQLILVEIEFKYLEIELFYKLYEQNNKNETIAFLYKNYFLIFKNDKFYYLQRIEENIQSIELLNYLNKNFEIDIHNFISVNSEDLYLKDDLLNDKNYIEYFNLKKSYSFFIYITYLIFLLLIFIYFYFNQNENLPQNIQTFDSSSLEKEYKFNSFEEKSRKIIFKIYQNNLNLINFEFDTNIIKIEVISQSKENIYKFLEDKEIVFLSSSIDYEEEKNTYKAKIDVKLFE